MDSPRPEKVAVVDEVRERFSGAQAAVLTEYRGLDVTAMAEVRRALRAAGGDYKIFKNTLVRFAARDLGLEIDDLLTGPTAIAFVQSDAAGVAKALRDFARTHPALVVKGGVLGTRVIGADDVQALADLPSREQLLAQIAGLMAAPLQQFAGLLDAVPRSFAYALQALIDKGGAPGAPTAGTADEPPGTAADGPEVTAGAEAPAGDTGAGAPAHPDTTDTETGPAPDAAAPSEES